jgi:hypothetical protein
MAAANGGGVAAARDVAVFVKAMLGEEIDKQREAVRAWLSASEPSQVQASPPPSAPSSVSAAAMSFPGEEFSRSRTGATYGGFEPPRRSRTPLVMSLLLLVPLAGGVGFWFARNKGTPAPVVVASPRAPVQAPAAAPAAETTPKPTTEPAPEPTPSAEPSSAATAAPAPARAGTRRVAPAKKKAEAGEDLDVRNPYR